MKWRSSAIYLLILLLLGAYFYYFEVLVKVRKETAEKESRRVFSFQPDGIDAIEIVAVGAQPVRLDREGGWKVVAPIRADIDRGVFDGFLSGLKKLEMERRVSAAPENLAAFGLDNPPLRLRIQAEGKWTDLLVGQSNPAGDAWYAKTDAKPDVFLITRGNYDILNKTAKDLRKKELLSFQPEDASGLVIAWRGLESLRLERKPNTREWTCPDAPGLKIRSRKIDEAIEELHWLRAVDFPQDAPAPDPALVTVSISLPEGRKAELKVGEPDEKSKQALALGSDLPSTVRISTDILAQIPKSAAALEDRAILQAQPDQVKELKWTRNGTKNDVVKIDDKEWGSREDGGAPKPFDESWRVRALLFQIGDAQYEAKVEPRPEPPAAFQTEIEIFNDQGTVASLAWEKPGGKGPAVVWTGTGDDRTAVTLKPDTLERMENTFDQLAASIRKK